MDIEVGRVWLVVDRNTGTNYYAEDDGSLSGMLCATAERVSGDKQTWVDEDNFYIMM